MCKMYNPNEKKNTYIIIWYVKREKRHIKPECIYDPTTLRI